jgi:hypothetical protein
VVLLSLAVLALASRYGLDPWDSTPVGDQAEPRLESRTPEATTGRIAELFRTRESGVMVSVAATVDRSLADDHEGSRHQRFLLRLDDGLSLLVAHNLDLAPRVPIEAGDRVEVRGQYEWNEKGGVLHWTHHDPDGEHERGWIRAGERTYE